jgi:probable phosphoglycerate mutase
MTQPDVNHTWPPAPRRRVYLMRHGEVEYFDANGRPFRPETVPLTAAGEEQARAAGAALADVPIDRAFTSGLARTNATARLVLAERDVPLDEEPRLREIETGRMSEWEKAPSGLVRRTILDALSEEITPESRFLAGETFAACQLRVGAVWDELLARRDWQVLLLVAHGMVNRLILARLLGMPLGSLGRLEQDAACVNLIEIDDAGRALVRLVNYTAYDCCKHTLRRSTLEGLYEQYLRGRKG